MWVNNAENKENRGWPDRSLRIVYRFDDIGKDLVFKLKENIITRWHSEVLIKNHWILVLLHMAFLIEYSICGTSCQSAVLMLAVSACF